MKVSTPVILGLLVVSLLSGCSVSGTLTEAQGLASNSNNYGAANETSTMNTSNTNSDAESFIPIGKKVKIWYLQHSTNDNYQVGLRDTDKKLVWMYVTPANVYLEDDIDTSYIERIGDIKDGFGLKHAQFNFHLKVDMPIKGGTEHDGDNSIQTDMIIGGGSW
ncbi:hypothetical protein EHV15_35290 [Paenibacillus oralis]|uniref:Lipoprotein n=1 Tax=Paenibacillus oralis TaxID=2490856 RepID=A0A3P3TA58_9BACL|nr:hypothetical protein [Paenibacillus oralis]RRJ54840.1 hypothetical protein EHV15_35290 [Paenibacillus oralis]